MGRFLSSLGVLLLTIAVNACAGFEHSETIVLPSAPSPASGAGGSGGLTGTWGSPAAEFPNPSRCGNFQWSITSQTSSSLAGQFSAICSSVVLVQGNASGQLNGAGTEVALQVNGTATVQSAIECPFDLKGTGFIQGNDAIRIVYWGTTCLGPVQGEEMLRRPADPNAPQLASTPPEPPPDPEPTAIRGALPDTPSWPA